MVEESSSIMVNDVWEVVSMPHDRSMVGSRWIYKVKYVADHNVEKYKARFVGKGYAQKKGINYEETFALVAKYTSIRIMISLAAQIGIIQAHQRLQEEPSHKIRHEGFGTDALFPGVGRLEAEGQLIGSLMYLVNIRLDICYIVNTLSQFMVEHKRAHWETTKHVLRRRMEATNIFLDNQSCIKLSENPIFHHQSKHIDIKCHFVKDYVQRGAVQLRCIPIGEQVVDILTKALKKNKV
eukprot:PITA_03023